LLTDAAGEPVWDPERARDVGRARDALAEVTARAADSLCRDLSVVADRSDRFLRSLVYPDRLGKTDELDQAGGTYIHPDRKIIVYSLLQPGLDPLPEAAPPYHRMLLAARTVHEWGHLAADAGWVRVPDDKVADFEEMKRDVQRRFDAAIAEAPPEVAAMG